MAYMNSMENPNETFDIGELYHTLSMHHIDVTKRLELFTTLKEQFRLGNITPTRIAPYHIHFSVDLITNFNMRPGLGELKKSDKLLLPALEFTQEIFLMGDKNFNNVLLKSQLMLNLAKLVNTFAERTEVMTRNLSRLCNVDTVLGCSRVVPPYEILSKVIDVPNVPEVFYNTNVCKVVEMQHRYDCECADCKELPVRPPIPPNPSMLASGEIGTNMYPLRHITQHLAAICPLPDYWEFIEGRSKKIGDEIAHLMNKDKFLGRDSSHQSGSAHKFVAGQQVAVITEALEWMNYDQSITLAPPLPAYLRGFVVGECHISLNRPRIGIWMPDFALCGLCEPDKLILLPEFSSVRTFAPLVYIASACPPVPLEAVSVAISLIYEVLKKYSRQDGVKLLLEDKGPWKTVQLLRFLDSGDTKAKLLAIINMLITCEKDDKGGRGVFACCLHNTLADWLVWKVYTQRMPDLELQAVLQGLTLLIPRVETRKWLRRNLVLQAIHALMRDEPSGDVMELLLKCKDMLAWNITSTAVRKHHQHRLGSWGPRGRPQQYMRHDRHTNYQHRERDQVRQFAAHYEEQERNAEEEQPPQYSVGRKPRIGEAWYSCTKATYSLVVPPAHEPGDCLDVIRSTMKSMVRGLLYQGAVQGVNCELMQVINLHEVRQPLLARLMCGMLNSGGGQIYIGLGVQGLVLGVHAPRPERDSFTQGVLDVVTYCLEPHLMPFSYNVERRVVLKNTDHVPDSEWHRYVLVLHLRPQPGVVYKVVPEMQSFIRRSPDGTTVCLGTESSP